MPSIDYTVLNLILLIFATVVLAIFVVLAVAVAVLYVIDVRQTQHATPRP